MYYNNYNNYNNYNKYNTNSYKFYIVIYIRIYY